MCHGRKKPTEKSQLASVFIFLIFISLLSYMIQWLFGCKYQLKKKALLKLNIIINSSIKFYSVICLNGVILTTSMFGTLKKNFYGGEPKYTYYYH